MRSMSVVDSHETDPGTIIVFQHYSNILSKVYEANAMSEEMEKVRHAASRCRFHTLSYNSLNEKELFLKECSRIWAQQKMSV